jgi:hypothetical protein
MIADMSESRVDPPRWKVTQEHLRRHTAKLVGAPDGFRFLCGACLPSRGETEVYIDHREREDRGEALAWKHTSHFKCKRCPADYNRDFGKVTARVRKALQHGRMELILGEDL